jgi:Leu/Phe-tRNA-protein transferase
MQKNGLKKEKKEGGHYEVMTKYLDFVQSIFHSHDFASKVVLAYFLEKSRKGTWTFDGKQA